MKKNYFCTMLAAATLMTGMTSCNNEENGMVPAEGKPTFMELKVAFKAPGTYATVDDNATNAEAVVNSVSVFIFDQGSGLLTSKGSLVASDFTQGANGQKDTYTATKKVATSTGDKYVYVGVNLPASFDLNIGATISEMKTGIATASANDLTNTVNGFAMFSAEDKTADLVETSNTLYSTNNTVTVNVERLSVKVTVEEKAGLVLATGGGVLSNLEFAIRQSNTKMFRYKNVDATIVKDPNWDTYAPADFENFTDYATVNAAGTAVKSLAARYASENTSKLHLEKETTYASIRANFVPDYFLDGTGVSKGSNIGQPAKSFWMVMTNDGIKNYFETVAEADAYMALPAVAAKAPAKSAEYVNGVCYYNMFLNPAGGYNAIRNSFYKATITQIIAPGNPTPEPKDPEQPVETETDILVNFDVLPWTLVEWGQPLK